MSEEIKPMFFEDTDYSLKVTNAGYSIGVAKSAYVWHKEHESLKQLSNKGKEEIFSKSRNIFEKKWGKILRVAWIIDDHKDLNKSLSQAIDLARSGNFVWLLVKDADVNESIFLDNNYFIHSGVKFIKYKNKFHLIWLILKKKKRYNPLISKNKFIKFFFRKFGYKVLDDPIKEEIKKLKYS